jgi:hypothetical protein
LNGFASTLYAYLDRLRFRPPFLRGTFFPFLRASESPIAIACLRLFTLPPFPPRPLRSVPRLRLRIALSTSLLAPRLYFFPVDFFLPLFRAMMLPRLCSMWTTAFALPHTNGNPECTRQHTRTAASRTPSTAQRATNERTSSRHSASSSVLERSN